MKRIYLLSEILDSLKKRSKSSSLLDRFLSIYILVIFLIISIGGLGIILAKEVVNIFAGNSCPQTMITGNVIWNADSEDGVFDCSSQTITVTAGSKLTLVPYISDDNNYTNDHGVSVLAENLIVEEGGEIVTSGYDASEDGGSGGIGGTSIGTTGGSGGGHAGAGGLGDTDQVNEPGAAGKTYGSDVEPVTLGSGGGASGTGANGGSGGGSVKFILSGTFNLNGKISSDGMDGAVLANSGGGGGAGGSIWVIANEVTGNGLATAKGGNGGNATNHGGGGGGGRIAIFCNTSNSYEGTLNVSGGSGGDQNGQIGTLIGPDCYPDAPENLNQYKVDTSTVIGLGERTSENQIVFKFLMSDVDNVDTLYPQVEIQPKDTAFTGIPTKMGTGISYSGTPVLGSVNINNLSRGIEYHWRARVRDQSGAVGPWESFGENSDGDTDVIVVGSPAQLIKVSGNGQSQIVGTQLAEPFVVEIRDAYGYTLPNISLSWQVANGGGLLNSASSVTDNEGQASVLLTLGNSAGINNNEVYAVKTGVSGSPAIFSASAIADAVDTFQISGPSAALINTNFSPCLHITAKDHYGNTVSSSNDQINLSAVLASDGVTPGNGNISQNSVTLTSGEADVCNLQYDTAENIKMKVTFGEFTGLSNTINVVSAFGSCFGFPNSAGTITLDTNYSFTADQSNGGVINCSEVDLVVNNNALITLQSYNSSDGDYTNDFGVTLIAKTLTIDSTSQITANGLGYGATQGPGAGSNYYCGNSAPSHGGYGNGNVGHGQVYGDVYEPKELGSGTGAAYGGVAGGGAIKIVTDTLTNNGVISADGIYNTGDSATCNSGSAGGSLWIVTDTLNGNGSGKFTADGKASTWSYGTGGGGRIAIYYVNDNLGVESQILNRKVTAFGGGAGTIYTENTGVQINKSGNLYVDNNGYDAEFAGLVSGSYQFEKITLSGNGNLSVLGTGSILTVANTNGLNGDNTSDLNVFGTLIIPNDMTVNNLTLAVRGDLQSLVDGQDTSNMNIVVGSVGKMILDAGAWGSNGGLYEFESVNVSGGGILYLDSADNGDSEYTNDFGVTLDVDTLTIEEGGSLNSDGLGYGVGIGPGSGYNGYCYAAAPSHGGFGSGNSGSGNIYGDVYEPTALGSGSPSGYGGVPGGGAIKIESDILNLNGKISSDGVTLTGSACNTGSTGGSVWIVTNILNGTATGEISADGKGHIGSYRGAAGGGRIAVYYSTDNMGLEGMVSNHKLHAFGGAYGYIGGAGTVYTESVGVQPYHAGNLYIDNNGYNGANAGLIEGDYEFEQVWMKNYGHVEVLGDGSRLTITGGSSLVGDNTLSKLTVDGTFNTPSSLDINGIDVHVKGQILMGSDSELSSVTIGTTSGCDSGACLLPGKLTLYAKTWARPTSMDYYEFGDISVGSNGNLTLISNDDGDGNYSTTDDWGVTLNVGDLVIEDGGKISADGLGYGATRGPGAGSNYYCGAVAPSHGGYGSGSAGNAEVYGDVYEPAELGSGSGAAYGGSGGGGAIKIIANNITNDGKISADGIYNTGDAATCNTGSAGGSIWIRTGTLNGSGAISADGKGSSWNHGTAGGGRIAIYYATDNIDIESQILNRRITVFGGGAGTIYTEDLTSGQIVPFYNSKLYVDNNNVNNKAAGLLEDEYLFQKISLTGYGHLRVLGQNSLLTLVSNLGIVGDSTVPDLTIDGTLNAPALLTINGVDVGINGDIQMGANPSDTVLKIGATSDCVSGTCLLPGGMTLYAKTWAHTDYTDEYTFGDITIGTNGTLTLVSNSDADSDYSISDDFGVTLNVGTMTIEEGGLVSSDGLGYGVGIGPGAGYNGYCYAVAPSHGGFGSGSSGAGSVYGDVYEPTALGSGSPGGYGGVPGGGAIKIIGNTLNLEGRISADGVTLNGSACNTGSTGGSVWIVTNNLNGTSTGEISADGKGHSGSATGAAGGGRIAIYYSNDNLGLEDMFVNRKLHAYGGVHNYVGGAGTIYTEDLSTQEDHAGNLYIDNNGYNGANAGLVEGDYQFERIFLKNYGHLEVLGEESNLTVASGSGLVGDNSIPKVIINGVLNGPSVLGVNGVNLSIKGDLSLGNDASLSVLKIGSTSDCEFTECEASGTVSLYAKTWAKDSSDDYYQFGQIDIGTNGTMLLVGNDDGDGTYTTTDDWGVNIVAEDIDIEQGGIMSAEGLGYTATHGPGAGSNYYCGSYGPSHGGYGIGSAGNAETYGDIYEPVTLGSGTGAAYGGVSGGGAIKLTTQTINIDGTLSANGIFNSGDPATCNSGSTGGSIWIVTDSLSGSESSRISADGKGSTWTSYGKGGGGRIAIYYGDDSLGLDSAILNHSITAVGGGPGTIYTENTGIQNVKEGNLYIDNNAVSGRGMSFEAQDYKFDNLFIGQNVTLTMKGDTNSLSENEEILGRGVKFIINGDFYLGEGAHMDADYQGFGPGEGPGNGLDGSGSTGGSGGGHAGRGGNSQDDGVNPEAVGGNGGYGSTIKPLTLGSGGGAAGTGAIGGRGGGAVAIEASGDINILGSITAKGENGKTASPGGGGGAGGSIYLSGDNLSCQSGGSLNVAGGNGGNDVYDGGGGGGGYVVLLYLNNENVGCTVADNSGAGGDGAQAGGEGVYGLNGVPVTPPDTSNKQLRTDGTTEIPVGGSTNENEVILQFTMSDPDVGQYLTPEAEVVGVGDAFTGASLYKGDPFTNVASNILGVSAGSPVQYNGGSPIVANVPVPGLILGQEYKWRARVIDEEGVASAWSDYGLNSDSSADFVVNQTASLEITVSPSTIDQGESVDITVIARDYFSQLDPNYRGTVDFDSSDTLALLPNSYTFTDSDLGQKVFTAGATLFTAGTQTITVEDSVNSLDDQSDNITVNYIPEVDNPPQISNVHVVSINPNEVIIGWNTNEPTISQIEYGINSYTNTTIIESTYSTSHQQTISGLNPETIYNFRVVAYDTPSNQQAVSDDYQFTTSVEGCSGDDCGTGYSFEFDSIQISNITTTSANIVWSTNQLSNGYIEYGTTLNYGNILSITNLSTSHINQLITLVPNSEYHFRIIAVDELSNEITSNDFVFTTDPKVIPPAACTNNCGESYNFEFVNIEISELTSQNATIAWNTNQDSKGYVEYGTTESFGSKLTVDELSKSHNTLIQNLQTGKKYYFRIVAVDGNNKEIFSKTFTFDILTELPITGDSDVKQCINVYYSTITKNIENSELIVQGNTLSTSNCTLLYGVKGEGFNYSVNARQVTGNLHEGKISLGCDLQGKDIQYKFSCMDQNQMNCSTHDYYINKDDISDLYTFNCKIRQNEGTKFVLPTLSISLLAVFSILLLLANNGLIFKPSLLLLAIPTILSRKKQSPWGIVYDVDTLKPIAFAVIRLYSSNSNKLVGEKVSDLKGRYSFSVHSDDYKIVVEHEDYLKFESEFKLSDGNYSINLDVQMINPRHKATFNRIYRRVKMQVKDYSSLISKVIFVFGIVLTLVSVYFSPNAYNYSVLTFYLVLIISYSLYYLFKPKEWGRVYDSQNNKPIHGAFVRLFHEKEKKLIDTQITDQGGRFGFIVDPADYMILVSAAGYKFPSKKESDSKLEKTFYGSLLKVKVIKDQLTSAHIPLDKINQSNLATEYNNIEKFASPFN